MSVNKLSSRQIFGMKRTSVEKKIEAYFEETKDATTVLQYTFALLLRNALSVNDFSGMLTGIIQQILLNSSPDNTLRSLAPFFKSYFSSGEWGKVITRLFGNKKNYHAYAESISHYKQYLFEETTPIEDLDNQQYKFVSVFLKGNGETHTWSLRDADPNISEDKFQAMLELLSMLTVFEKDGIRLFVEVVGSDLMNCTRRSLIKKRKANKSAVDNEEPEILYEEKLPFGTTFADLFQTKMNEEEQKMEISLPVGTQLEDLNQEELLKIVEEQLPAGATLTGLRLARENEAEPKDVPLFDYSSTDQQSVQEASIMTALKDPPKQEKMPASQSPLKKHSNNALSKNEIKQRNDNVTNYFLKKKSKSERKRGRAGK